MRGFKFHNFFLKNCSLYSDNYLASFEHATLRIRKVSTYCTQGPQHSVCSLSTSKRQQVACRLWQKMETAF